MKWHVEDIGIHAHIMCGEETLAIGMPVKLAYSLVRRHNEGIDKGEERAATGLVEWYKKKYNQKIVPVSVREAWEASRQETITMVLEIIGKTAKGMLMIDEDCYKTEYRIVEAIKKEFGIK